MKRIARLLGGGLLLAGLVWGVGKDLSWNPVDPAAPRVGSTVGSGFAPPPSRAARATTTAVATAAAAADFIFGAEVLDRPMVCSDPNNCVPYGFERVAIADVTGDGLDDLVATTSNSIWVIRQLANNTLDRAHPLLFTFNDNHTLSWDQLALGDLNEDGVTDIVGSRVTNTGDYSGVSLVLSDGKGGFRFQLVPSTADGFAEPRDLEVMDVNLDGHLDLMAIDRSHRYTLPDGSCCIYREIWYGDGHGAFGQVDRIQEMPPLAPPLHLESADFNGDGLPDATLLDNTESGGPQRLLIAYHLSAGGLQTPVPVGPDPTVFGFHAYGDFNRDGRIDIASGGIIGGGGWLQTGPSTFATSMQLPPMSNYPHEMLAVDLDRDGATDLVAPQLVDTGLPWGTEVVQAYVQRNRQLVSAPQGPPADSNTPGGDVHPQTAAGDLNGDGCTDVVLAHGQMGYSVFYGEHCQHVAAAASDFNGDHHSDLVWHNSRSTANVIWQKGSFALQQHFAAFASTDWMIAGMGDIDGDGRSDLVLRHRVSGANVLWFSANSRRGRALATVSDLAWQIAAVADIDGDLLADIVWRNATTGANSIWKSGDAMARIALPPVALQWSLAGAADLDGDGRADLLWRNRNTGQNVLWKAANAANSTSLASAAVSWQVAGLGDFDGDGKADIAWRNSNTGANVIWRSGLSSTSLPVTTVTNLDWQVMAVGDYDNDGHADLAWRNTRTGANVIWLQGRSSYSRMVFGVTNMDWQVAR